MADDASPRPRRRPSPHAEGCDSKRIDWVSLYRPRFSSSSGEGGGGGGGGRRGILRVHHMLFLFLYLCQAMWVISTIGEPYRKFLEKADREGFRVMEGHNRMRAELQRALSDIDDPDRPPSDMGWFDWMGMDVEEHAERRRRERERTVLDGLPRSMRVPGRYAPAFTPCLVGGVVVVLHVLAVLMQHWSVRFNVWVNYAEVAAVDVEVPDEMTDIDSLDWDEGSAGGGGGDGDGGKSPGERILDRAARVPIPAPLPTHARVTPADGGGDVLVPLLYLPTLGVTFEYHRRRYFYDLDSRVWTKVRCVTSMPTSFFARWEGLATPEEVTAKRVQFGGNVFDIRQPTFKELYKSQLLSPFTVFQLFCVVLWMLDDYWQYSALTLLMILGFEATVVFSRLKSLGALRGMGNRPRPVLVYRLGGWAEVPSHDLLPGDLVSVTRHRPRYHRDGGGEGGTEKGGSKGPEDSGGGRGGGPRPRPEDEHGDIVPADALLLRGSCVVNESSLTGESVPQMKEGLSEFSEGERLSMKTSHRGHVLYAGTRMLQCKGVGEVEAEEESSDEEDEDEGGDGDDGGKAAGDRGVAEEKPYASIPPPPDGGCLCFVLRTGFSSAQGKLVRMIEGSRESVGGHERDTALLLLLLFFFAVASSSYVLYHGVRDEGRSQYELLLHCVLIITSVIPPELPMQMALAVNNSLMTLMRMQVFCTEPYRVPAAGKLDCCLFDKTGTLTTDELVAVGVLRAGHLREQPVKRRGGGAVDGGGVHRSAAESRLTPMTGVSDEAGLVLAGCHSLVLVDGETAGDPLEAAALSAMRWGPSPDHRSGRVLVRPLPSTERRGGGSPLSLSGVQIRELEILSRHHFSSKLQRMSCVVAVRDAAAAAGGRRPRTYSVVKGSPEAVGTLLSERPKGYDDAAGSLSKGGYRVISLAYRALEGRGQIEAAGESRDRCEGGGLTFAGFVAFTCRVRRDTRAVLKRLRRGGMSVAMVTGDALLTAAHVAREVSICDSGDDEEEDEDPTGAQGAANQELRDFLDSRRARARAGGVVPKKKRAKRDPKPILILERGEAGVPYWRNYDDDRRVGDFIPSEVPDLAGQYDLATTGENLSAAFTYDEVSTGRVLGHFKVFARMTPDDKENVIERLRTGGSVCLMCGDGANDVGALKRADVGVALLGGFGDVNVDRGEDGSNSKKKKDGKGEAEAEAGLSSQTTAIVTQQQLDALRMMPVRLLKAQVRAMGVDPDRYGVVEKEDLVKLYQIRAREMAVRRHDRKSAADRVKMTRAEVAAKHKADMAEKQRKMQARVQELEAQGVKWASFKATKEFLVAEMEEGKKKKAQMAKSRSIEGSAASMVAQLEDLDVDELPVVKIGDASIAAPFTSKMPSIRSCVDIVRQGRCTLVTSIQMYQILALNCLISSYSLSVLYLDGMKYGDKQMTAMGILGSISYMSVSRSRPLEKLSPVKPLTSIFHPSLFVSLLGQFAIHLVTMMTAVKRAKDHLPEDYKVDLDGDFRPGIFNSVVFLVSNVQQVTVFVVNLQGRPFMNGLTENRPLLWSLLVTFILTFMFASETVPALNRYFELVPFPDDNFRDFILRILVADVAACFTLDRLMKFIFCPGILFASMEGTTMADVLRLGRTVGVIVAIMYVFLANDERWEEMMRMEEEGYSNETALDGNVTDGATEAQVLAAEL